MKTYTLEINNETLVDKIIWMLSHFKDDGLIIREGQNGSAQSSIKQSVHEMNLVTSGKLKAAPIEDLMNEL